VAERLVFPDSWWDLRGGGVKEQGQRSVIQRELRAEIAAGHPLAGVSGEVIARSTASDDVLILLEGGRWALVHLTWRCAPEAPPWPFVEFYDSVQALERALPVDD
jgi:hypothetical protein